MKYVGTTTHESRSRTLTRNANTFRQVKVLLTYQRNFIISTAYKKHHKLIQNYNDNNSKVEGKPNVHENL